MKTRKKEQTQKNSQHTKERTNAKEERTHLDRSEKILINDESKKYRKDKNAMRKTWTKEQTERKKDQIKKKENF